jgi:hypothetical protein
MENDPKRQDDRGLLALWLAVLAVLALVVGIAAGGIEWLGSRDVAQAIKTGCVAFAGAVTLGVLVIGVVRR